VWDLIGHEQAVERLRRGLHAGRVAHAYLITGPAQVGKRTLALRLAQALNCTGPEPPCGECRSCRRIQSGTHLDVRVVQLEANAGNGEGEDGPRPRTGVKNIGIGQVQALQREVALSPYEGGRKVYIILDAENLSIEAGNSLLKVLEEPPPQVVLLLTATDANMLLPTIVSRCQPIRLPPVPAAVIAAHLRERYSLAAERAEVVARLACGRVGWAIAAAEDESRLSARAETLARLVGLGEARAASRLDLAGKLAVEFGRDRGGVYLALELWTMWWRDVLLLQAGDEELVTNVDQLAALRGQATRGTLGQTHAYLAQIEATRLQLEQNVNPRLALEALCLNVPQGAGTLV